ncbi:MAG: response regulator transcription factor [Chloroflexi bacterium]|nr:response regulator transcription factor [Chloroflexota bacterium]
MTNPTRVAFLEDHLSIIDGYVFRLQHDPHIEVVASAMYGRDLEEMLRRHAVDVLVLDVSVPTSPDNPNLYPILHEAPALLQEFPDTAILVISMHAERALIRALVEAGVSGYILKDDREAIHELSSAIKTIAAGGIYFSHYAQQALSAPAGSNGPALTVRQREVLSLCAAYPDLTTAQIARKLGVANSTLRNLLSGAYLRLEVRSRPAAVARARQLGLIAPEEPRRVD